MGHGGGGGVGGEGAVVAVVLAVVLAVVCTSVVGMIVLRLVSVAAYMVMEMAMVVLNAFAQLHLLGRHLHCGHCT